MGAQYCQLARQQGVGWRNVGDALIHHSGRQLLREAKGPVEVMVIPQSDSLAPVLDEVNRCRAVVMLPALRERTWPDVVVLTDPLEAITVPLAAWGAADLRPAQHLTEASRYSPDAGTRRLLDRIRSDVGVVACRDRFTQWELAAAGYPTALVGDPAFYDPALIGTAPVKPDKIRRVAFTPPRRADLLAEALAVLRTVREELPDAEVRLVRHALPGPTESRIEDTVGLPIIDAYGDDISRLAEVYSDVDLHVGYRVHGHLWRVRTRRPSILLQEDSRAVGFSATLRQLGVRSKAVLVGQSTGAQLARKVVRRLPRPRPGRAPGRVRELIRQHVGTDFEPTDAAARLVDAYYEHRMMPYLRSLP